MNIWILIGGALGLFAIIGTVTAWTAFFWDDGRSDDDPEYLEDLTTHPEQ